MVQNKSRLRGLQIKSPDPAWWRDARTRRVNTTAKYNPKPFQTYIRPGSQWAAGTAAGRSGRAGWAGGRLASFCRWPLTWLDSRGPTGWRRGVCTLDVWRSREKEETVVSAVQTCVLTLFPSQPSSTFTHFPQTFPSEVYLASPARPQPRNYPFYTTHNYSGFIAGSRHYLLIRPSCNYEDAHQYFRRRLFVLAKLRLIPPSPRAASGVDCGLPRFASAGRKPGERACKPFN